MFNNSNDTHSNTLKWINEIWIEKKCIHLYSIAIATGQAAKQKNLKHFFYGHIWKLNPHCTFNMMNKCAEFTFKCVLFGNFYENMLNKRKHHWLDFINRIMFTFLNLCFGFCFSISKNARFQEQRNLLSK